MGPQRQQFVALVAKELHKEQPWFHDRISRDEADILTNADGHKDGKYLYVQYTMTVMQFRIKKKYIFMPTNTELQWISNEFRVRLRDDKSYALSLSFKNQTKHYKIDKHVTSTGDKLAIEDGPRFDNLMDVRLISTEGKMGSCLWNFDPE